jgi:dTDP-4-amino-4,6-dideoxygalactose transaminase
LTYLPFTRPTIDDDAIAAVSDTLRSGWLASGPRSAEFERALTAYLGGRTVRVLTSGTAGLEVALQACGIGPGDEVITPAMSFAATPNMILKVGAKPVFVDVDARTRNIDLALAEAAIGPRTKAIMPVHFAGLAVDLDALYDLAARHRLRVIEDAAHAIGTEWRGERIGSRGDMVVFSFHPNKNMTSIEGGAISVAGEEDARRIDHLRFHGIVRDAQGTMDVVSPGGKFNLPDVNARLGIAQLGRLAEFNARRRALVDRYFRRLAECRYAQLPHDAPGHSWHIFAPLIRFADLGATRREFVAAMHARDIGVGIHYPALHTFSLYRSMGYAEEAFPNAARAGRETVTLPLFPLMLDTDVDRVCDAMDEVLRRP